MGKRKIKKPKVITYKVSSYQIQIKGPTRNKTLDVLFDKLLTDLKKGNPLTKQDKYGNVVRAISAVEESNSKTVKITLVKYNTIATGLSWDSSKEKLLENPNLQLHDAQKTFLIIYPEEHLAFHIHRPKGPKTSEIETYLSEIFDTQKIKSKIDCSIDVIPRKVPGEILKISKWRVIKKFSIEVIRPNPSGSIRTKQLKDALNKTSSDKVTLTLESKELQGIPSNAISNLIMEGDELVKNGQGYVKASGRGSGSKKLEIDSRDTKVMIEEIKTTDEDERTLSEIILEYYESTL